MRNAAQLILISMLFFCFGIKTSMAQWSILEGDTSKNEPYYMLQEFSQEEWEASNFASRNELNWFNDARYGMFIHFGLSTYKGKDLSWGICKTRKAPDQGTGPYPESVWTKWPGEFEFEHFNAEEWVAVAKKAGMKYVVTIAKHHDGFHLWDTKFSDFKVTNTPFGRDYLGEIADACHNAGMKFGIYYSQRDWYHPDYTYGQLVRIRDEQEAKSKNRNEIFKTKIHTNYRIIFHWKFGNALNIWKSCFWWKFNRRNRYKITVYIEHGRCIDAY